MKKLWVYMAAGADPQRAAALAEKLNLPLTEDAEEAEQAGLLLRLDGEGLSLCDGKLQLRGDFTQLLPRLKQGRLQQEMLVKAARIRGIEHPTAVDATAGLGEDALLLAAAGFSVRLYEYDPVIAALLADTLRRAAEHPALAEIVGRMQLFEEDSLQALPQLAEAPDVVLLDPMFPERQKSALIKKKFQLLQQLERPCAEEEDLLAAAVAANPRKIVIKRPVKGPYLAGKKPSHSIAGKAVRYDCFAFARG